MRIASPEVIRREEQALIEGIKSVFRLDAFSRQFKDNHRIELAAIENLDGGDILVRNNQVVFELGLLCKINFALLIDRHGNYLAFDDPNHQEGPEGEAAGQPMLLSAPDNIRQKEKEVVRSISEGIDMGNVRALFEKEFDIRLADETRFESGNIAIFDGSLAYRLIYHANLNLNLLIGMAGNLIGISPPEPPAETGAVDDEGYFRINVEQP